MDTNRVSSCCGDPTTYYEADATCPAGDYCDNCGGQVFTHVTPDQYQEIRAERHGDREPAYDAPSGAELIERARVAKRLSHS